VNKERFERQKRSWLNRMQALPGDQLTRRPSLASAAPMSFFTINSAAISGAKQAVLASKVSTVPATGATAGLAGGHSTGEARDRAAGKCSSTIKAIWETGSGPSGYIGAFQVPRIRNTAPRPAVHSTCLRAGKPSPFGPETNRKSFRKISGRSRRSRDQCGARPQPLVWALLFCVFITWPVCAQTFPLAVNKVQGNACHIIMYLFQVGQVAACRAEIARLPAPR
jgi:hypothetical protein